MNKSDNFPILKFDTSQKWREWLEVNHMRTDGVWLQLGKKSSGVPTITHAQALDEALCFGWIDGQGKKLDEKSWLVKFTPRRKASMWSKRNRENVMRLMKEKRMTDHGLKEIENAKHDGRWDGAYDSPKNMTIPEDFLGMLHTDKKAESFFKTLNRSNVYAIAWRLQTAKNHETRNKRIQVILTMLKEGKKFH